MRRKIKSLKVLILKTFRKLNKCFNQTAAIEPQSLVVTEMAIRSPSESPTFLFPPANSTVLPDPSRWFSPLLLSAPLPTNSFFQNFVLKNGDQPEYIHPYLIKSSTSGLSICYPPRFSNSSFIYQIFNQDLTISKVNSDTHNTHLVSSFSDLSVTLDFPSSNLRFFLVRGSPYLTCEVTSLTAISISTIHAIISFSCNSALTKFTIKLNNGQTWVIYTSSPIDFTHSMSEITSSAFLGIIRIATVPSSSFHEVLDLYKSCYPVSGYAEFSKPFSFNYKWEKKGWGDLLLLAHPLHINLLYGDVTMLNDFRFDSIDGNLVGVVGDSWSMKLDPIPLTWHSVRGIRDEGVSEIVSSLRKDVGDLNSKNIPTSSSYFYGKLIARAARLALIAEEVCFIDVIPSVRLFLREAIEPWLDGTFTQNGFLYNKAWGGIVSKQGLTDSGADFGFGIFNDHHYHLGYFLYAIAVLVKLDTKWGRKYMPQVYSLLADIMTLGSGENVNYTRLRCFDLWKLHSWAGGLSEFADGRNQESTSEAVNAYYSAALIGLAYGDTHLVTIGSTLAAMEIRSAQTWWHIKEESLMYEKDFTGENRVVGVLWANKRDSGLWFAPPEWKECRTGIQLLPILPITEILFSDVEFVKQLVKWTLPALERDGVGEGWKGFVYALQAIYDKRNALDNILGLKGHDDGNSLTNLLWWVYTRDDGDEEVCEGWKYCLFAHCCH